MTIIKKLEYFVGEQFITLTLLMMDLTALQLTIHHIRLLIRFVVLLHQHLLYVLFNLYC